MFIYSQLFSWLVDRCNIGLVGRYALAQHGMTAEPTEKTDENFIGVLDIAGFENFKDNSLEQLWINFANEKLQQHFNFYVFKDEMADYHKEGVHFYQKIKNKIICQI